MEKQKSQQYIPGRLAMMQYRPKVNQLNESLQLLESLLQEAQTKGAQIAAFGESWLSGYPAWLDHCPEIGFWDASPTKKAFRVMYENSLELHSETFEELQNIISKHKLYVILGANERAAIGGTLYNSIFTFGSDGSLLNHHRKLMPTFTEKLVHGLGDGAGLKSVPTPYGRITSSICWEHWMPLHRQALHNAGEHLHIALWPMIHERHLLASRHYAFEGRCFVAALGQLQKADDFPKSLILPDHLKRQPETLVLHGGSCFIGPDGLLLSDPLFDEEKIILIDFNANALIEERMTLDVSGHYQRPDVFTFAVNENRQ